MGRRVRAAVLAAAVVGVGAAPPSVAAPVEGAQLRLAPACVGGRPGHWAEFEQDGTVRALRSERYSVTVAPSPVTPRTVRTVLPGPLGGDRWSLIGAEEAVLGSATAADVPCDGWYDRTGFVRGGSNDPWSPQRVGDLAERPVAQGGWEVHRGTEGALYVRPSVPGTRGHVVRGAIHEAYVRRGGPAGALGGPLSSEVEIVQPVRAGGQTGGTGAGEDQHSAGFSTAFERGTVLWSAQTGAHVVRGALAEAFHARGGVPGTGFPRGEEFGPLVRGGYGQVFTGGTLYWTPATGAHLVRDGLLMDRWARQGWETGELGYPVSEQFGEEGYAPRWQHFQGGSVYFAKPSTVVVKGAIREAYRSTGAEGGPLGFPRGEEERHGDGARQVFSGGTITWSPVTGTSVEFG